MGAGAGTVATDGFDSGFFGGPLTAGGADFGAVAVAPRGSFPGFPGATGRFGLGAGAWAVTAGGFALGADGGTLTAEGLDLGAGGGPLTAGGFAFAAVGALTAGGVGPGFPGTEPRPSILDAVMTGAGGAAGIFRYHR